MASGQQLRLEFARQLAGRLEHGTPLAAAVQALAESAPEPGWRRRLLATAAALRTGSPLSTALAAADAGFGREQLALLRVGEAANALPAALAELVRGAEATAGVGRLAWRVLTPWLVLPLVLWLPFEVALGLIVPHFVKLYVELLGYAPLPRLTNVYVGLSHLYLTCRPLLLLVLAGAAALLVTLLLLRLADRWWSVVRLARLHPGTAELLWHSDWARVCCLLEWRLQAGVAPERLFDLPPGVFVTGVVRRQVANWAAAAVGGVTFPVSVAQVAAAGGPAGALALAVTGCRDGAYAAAVRQAGELYAVRATPSGHVRRVGPLWLLVVLAAVTLLLLMPLALFLPVVRTGCGLGQ